MSATSSGGNGSEGTVYTTQTVILFDGIVTWVGFRVTAGSAWTERT
jgi:hypothetical protein